MIVVDTDVFIDYFRGIREAKEFIEGISIDERATTDLTIMELFKGARNKNEIEKIEKFIEQNFFITFPVTTAASRTAVQILKR
jgi:hypothetical protein